MPPLEKHQIDDFLFAYTKYHKEEHADRYIDHYLEQYRIYVYMLNSYGERRQKSNEFCLGLNTAILGVLGYFEAKEAASHAPILFVIIPIVGIVVCYLWYHILRSYRNLAKAKYAVIHLLERKLPAALFETEWEILGKGLHKSRYYPFSQIEKKIPITFMALYVIIIVINFPWNHVADLFVW